MQKAVSRIIDTGKQLHIRLPLSIRLGQRLLNSTRFLIGQAKSTGNPWLMFTDPGVPIGYH